MSESLESRLDRRQVRRLFVGREPAALDSELSRRVAEELLARLDVVRITPQILLDAGCGTGHCARALAARYPDSISVGLDVAAPLLVDAVRREAGSVSYIAGNADFLPFADQSLDLIVSSLALPWCEVIAFAVESRRAMRAGGLLMFSTFGPDTLHELRRAWAAVDDRPHVHSFFDMHDIGDVLVQVGFSDPVLNTERVTVTYRDVATLFADLKVQGFTNVHEDRRRGLTGRGRFDGFRQALETGRGTDGLLTLTYEIVYGHAWAPAGRGEGRVEVPIPGS